MNLALLWLLLPPQLLKQLNQNYLEFLVVVDEFKFAAPKTQEFVKILDAVKAGGKVLFVATEEDDATILSARNLPYVKIVYPQGINVYDIVNVDTLLVSEAALKTIEEVFA